jgi:hypothetical protein
MIALYLLAWSVTVAESPARSPGEIRGVVVNASQDNTPCPNTEVLLRVQKDGQFVPVEQTTTDAQGRFRFADLPLGRQFLYLPGAHRSDVHYPGSRIRLTGADPAVDITLAVRDTLAAPCPLVIKRHEILLRPEAGLLHVTESLRVSNPSSRTYVGQAATEGDQPVTLRLSIPRDFERTTFFEEFYSRQFSIAAGQLVTAIPWTPGERNLKFMYTIPNDQRYRVWERPMDLPCEQLQVRVVHDQSDDVACNLDPSAHSTAGERLFSSRGELLPAGHVVRVQLGQLPVPWMSYARWGALLVLLGLVASVSLFLGLGKHRARQLPATDAPVAASNESPRQRPVRRRKAPSPRRRLAA